ncbi:MAG TPA: family 1 glycosylhydrolase [Acidimicrobiales bacterium]|nr:family 1 glycosylhydrolase [Acidimicrobiales bacterium]
MAGPDHGLRTGAILGGFEHEGGFNGRGEPAHSWCWWEIEGRAPAWPASDGFRRRWDSDVARVAAAGFDTVRVCVEWARCEPLDGQVDLDAVAGYCRLLDVCHQHGLQPTVVLHRFAHPAWMGVDFWLRPDSPERFCSWVDTAVEHFAGRANQWVTIDQLNVTALFSYMAGRHPPGRRLDVAATIRSLDHLLAGHVLAYETIKERQPHGVVATGNRHLPVYELDRLLVDVLAARREGVGRHEVHRWLADRRSAYMAGPAGSSGGRVGRGLRRIVRAAIPAEQALARAVAAVYDSACERSLDVLQVSAEAGDAYRALPVAVGPGGSARWRPRGDEIEQSCRANRDVGVPLWVGVDGPVGLDGLRRNLTQVEAVSADGVGVTGYFQRVEPAALERLAGGNVSTRLASRIG